MSDGLYVSQSVSIMLVREFLRRGSVEVQSEQSLSKRELQVLELVGLGLDTRDIATKLYISAKTVEAHRWRIKQKLNLRRADRSYALRFATVPGGLNSTVTSAPGDGESERKQTNGFAEQHHRLEVRVTMKC